MTDSQPVRRVSNISRAQVSFQKQFSPMGVALLFRTNSLELLAAAEEALSRYPQQKDTDAPLIIELFVSDHEGRPAPYPPLICRSHGHLLSLSVGAENSMVSDLQAGYTFGYLTQAMAADQAFVRYTFIEAALQAMLGLGRDFVAIHAACVVKDGVSLLLAGASGAGKSTLAYACLKQGFGLLAEDTIQARIRPQGIELWGIPWKLHLLPDNAHLFPELGNLETKRQVNGEWKIEIDVQGRFPGRAVPRGGVGPVVFLERDGNASKAAYRRMSLEKANRRFEAIWSWEVGWREDYDCQLRDLLSRGAYLLQAGDVPEENVRVLDEIILHWKSLD